MTPRRILIAVLIGGGILLCACERKLELGLSSGREDTATATESTTDTETETESETDSSVDTDDT